MDLVAKGQATMSTIVTFFFLFLAFGGTFPAIFNFVQASLDTLGPLEKVLALLVGPVLLIGIVTLVSNREDLATFIFGKQRF